MRFITPLASVWAGKLDTLVITSNKGHDDWTLTLYPSDPTLKDYAVVLAVGPLRECQKIMTDMSAALAEGT